MNNDRRKEINELVEELKPLIESLEDIRSRIETLRDDECDYHASMPENFQSSERGQAAEAAVSALEMAVDVIEGIVDGSLVDSLEEAAA